MIFHTPCPVVRRERRSFVQFVGVGGKHRAVDFEREIVWIRESNSRIVLSHGGHEITTEGRTWDFAGFLTSPEISAAKARARKLQVDHESTLVVVLETEISEQPALELPAHRAAVEGMGPRVAYESIPDEWREPVPNERGGHSAVDTVVVEPWTPVWDSRDRDPDACAKERLQALRERWTP